MGKMNRRKGVVDLGKRGGAKHYQEDEGFI